MSTLQKFVQEKDSNDWSDVWKALCNDEWFGNTLDRSARSVLRKKGRPVSWRDDIKQQAMIEIARQLMKSPSLGYQSDRGNLRSFLSVVIFRSCQKACRQFRSGNVTFVSPDPLDEPCVDSAPELENQLDLHHCVDRLEEPFRTTAAQLLAGLTIEQMAVIAGCSTRTIYRRLNETVEQLRQQLNPTKDRQIREKQPRKPKIGSSRQRTL